MLPDGAADVQVLDLSDLPPSQPAPLQGATGSRFSRTLAGEAGNCFAVPFEALRHCFKRHFCQTLSPTLSGAGEVSYALRERERGSAKIFKSHVGWFNVESLREKPSASEVINITFHLNVISPSTPSLHLMNTRQRGATVIPHHQVFLSLSRPELLLRASNKSLQRS